MAKSGDTTLILITALGAAACVPFGYEGEDRPPSLPFEVDHVYLWVTAGAEEEVRALERLGLRVDAELTHHPGQGTSAVSVEFRNAYLELIYVDPAVAVDSALQETVRDFRRRSAWRETGASPVGIGFHWRPGDTKNLAIPSRPYHPDWLREGTTIERLGAEENPVAPRMFVVPDYLAVEDSAALLERLETDAVLASLLRHPIGIDNLTGVRVVLSDSSGVTEVVRALDATGLVRFDVREAPVLELEFDHRRQSATADLRPLLPLVLRY